ncbi:MAG: hypothetical protein EVJ46_01240 [Candidatus Acididesulfobacter guangdongensis]|uniref:Tetratricopeptide repeat protein n=1 Tax=Acididesulfobacter guangdongensis TaxID=2597225 RepID=A0A519BHZ3_ACIG2|nr:MAG: hypothetical protein EVJ46_01240 [Candidatus Acididesulfobacter guangdongensis]
MKSYFYLLKKSMLLLFSLFLVYTIFFSFSKINYAQKQANNKLLTFLKYSSIKPEFIKFVDLNFNTLFSDYFWTLFVQEASSDKLAYMHYPYMYKISLITVKLNKRFNYAYQASGTLLGLAGKPKRAIKILKLGLRHMGTNWNIPFLISFNYFYNLGNYAKAAHYLKFAVNTKGSPKYLEFLYIKLLNNSQNFNKAKLFLETMYKNNKNPLIRHIIKVRIDAINREIYLKSKKIKYKIPYSLKLFLPKKASNK